MVRHLRLTLTVGFGLGPGMLLPFALAFSLSTRQSDTFILALSFSVLLLNVVVASIEASSIAVIGEQIRRDAPLSARTLVRFALRNALQGLPACAIGVGSLLLIYVWSSPDPPELIACSLILCLAPVVGMASAVLSGALIAHERTSLPILSQGFRSILPLIAVILLPQMPLPLLCLLYPLGELVRLILLIGPWARLRRTQQVETRTTLTARGLYWQFASTSLTQANPVVDRFLLAGTGLGSITAYELADKVSFAIFQIAYNFGLLQRIGSWSTAPPEDRLRLFRRDLLKIALVTLAGSIVISAIIGILLMTPAVPEEWRLGLTWSLIAVFAMPIAISVTSSIRYLVILDAQRLLLPITIGGLIVNAVLDFLFLEWLGPIGIVLASIPTRAFLLVGMQLTISRLRRLET